ncbi:MAG: cell division protein FtsL [Pseudomonadota bacterium]
MRVSFMIVTFAAVVGLGHWAYSQNIDTQASIRAVQALQDQIGAERERLDRLEEEWAYQRRPDRLRALVELNFERLQLIPMTPQHYGAVSEIGPRPRVDLVADAILADILQSSGSSRAVQGQAEEAEE